MNYSLIGKSAIHPGVRAALGAALLFCAGTPLAKLLLSSVGPWMLAGLLYFGSGVGLALYRLLRRAPRGRLPRVDVPWFAAAILVGGCIGPVLLMLGLTGMPASGASLLLNAEGIFTALLAWFAFKENFDRRIVLGMLAIVAGVIVLSWPDDLRFNGLWPALSVLGACFAWGIDNNLTRKVSMTDATWIASVKGLVAGSVNLVVALVLGATWPPLPNVASALIVGFFTYGVSLTLFVVSLRHLGTARTGAYFSVAPFFGAVLAIAAGEPVTFPLVIAGVLMMFGVWLHLTERHEHPHTHDATEHAHGYPNDEHRRHADSYFHDPGAQHGDRHKPHKHTHPHFPDVHHRHKH